MAKFLVIALLSLTFAHVTYQLDVSPDVSVVDKTILIENVHRPGGQLKISINGVDTPLIYKKSKIVPIEFSLETDDLEIGILRLNTTQKVEHYLYWRANSTDNGAKELCFHYGHNNARWYSTYEEIQQSWPMDTSQSLPAAAFITRDFFQGPLGSFLETKFYNTDGFLIDVGNQGPLFIRRSPNNGDPVMCFSLKVEKPYSVFPSFFPADKEYGRELNVRISAYSNIMEARNNSFRYGGPGKLPDERMITYPVWSTWAKFGTNINQDKILSLAREIKARGFPNAQLEIDDKWEAHYGDFTFDPAKFPDAKKMIEELHSMGFRVTLWVYPFVNTDSDAYQIGINNSYFLLNSSNKTAIINWWDGAGGAIDFTHFEASYWFTNRLQKIKKDFGIDSFKFDAGEVGWMKGDVLFSNKRVHQNPNDYTKRYVVACSFLGSAIETRSAYRTQDLPNFVRLMDRNSNWDGNDGLKTFIPAALTFATAGYPYVLPDMIGGNNQPSEELYIRWMQATVFMAAMQFSHVPWEFSDRAENITKKYVDLHVQYAPNIINIMKANVAQHNGMTIRPMWWVDPEDEKTFDIADQYMLGDDILVAPVLEQGKIERKVYLPKGTWIEQNSNKAYTGPVEITVAAPLDVLPYFIKKH